MSLLEFEKFQEQNKINDLETIKRLIEEDELQRKEKASEKYERHTNFAVDQLKKLDTTNHQRYGQSKSIREVIERRNITKLVHFTHISNLKYILELGLIPLNKLIEYHVQFVGTDINRNINKDSIFLSVEFPNYKMFCSKKAVNNILRNENWIVLELDPKLLYNEHLRPIFNEINSSTRGADHCEGLSSDMFENMFSDNITSKKGKYIRTEKTQDNWTTDPQAEIRIRDRIKPCYILKVDFGLRSVYEKYCEKYPEYKELFKLEPSMFDKRKDNDFNLIKFEKEVIYNG